MVEAFLTITEKKKDRDEDTGSGLMIKTDRLSDSLLFLLVWMSAFFHFLYLFSSLSLSLSLSLCLSSLKHELLREGEGCVGVRGVTF